jgi:uncharacterized small protein (DUF1192 family)
MSNPQPPARVARRVGLGINRPGTSRGRAVLTALQAGRQSGLRVCSDLVNQLAERLSASADKIERLEAELRRERIKHRLARAMLKRVDVIDAQRERDDGDVTLH